MKIAPLAILFFLASPIFGQTNLTLKIGSAFYSDVRFGPVTPGTIVIYHSTGVATVPLSKLPVDLQQRFGYDPQKAVVWLEGQRTAELRRSLDLREIDGMVYDFSGLFKTQEALEKLFQDARSGASHLPDREYQEAFGALQAKLASYRVVGQISQITDDGLLITYAGYDLFLKHFPKKGNQADGDSISAFALETHSYSFTTVLGARRTVRCFDCGVQTDPAVYHGKVVLLPEKTAFDLP